MQLRRGGMATSRRTGARLCHGAGLRTGALVRADGTVAVVLWCFVRVARDSCSRQPGTHPWCLSAWPGKTTSVYRDVCSDSFPIITATTCHAALSPALRWR
mgnify:CR=1 FL=1